jgi:hypothetical protein
MVLVGKPKERDLYENLDVGGEHNIKIDLREKWWGVMECTHLAQDWDQ